MYVEQITYTIIYKEDKRTLLSSFLNHQFLFLSKYNENDMFVRNDWKSFPVGTATENTGAMFYASYLIFNDNNNFRMTILKFRRI